jgi:hypothetical protein
MNKKLSSIILIVLISFGCSMYYEKANDQAVERLNTLIKQGNYDEIYNQSSEILRRSISKEEFISKMKIATEQMKQVDETLTWEKDETMLFDKSVFRVEDFSYRVVSKNGKKAGIQIDWNTPFQLCSLHVLPNPYENDGVGFRYCD